MLPARGGGRAWGERGGEAFFWVLVGVLVGLLGDAYDDGVVGRQGVCQEVVRGVAEFEEASARSVACAEDVARFFMEEEKFGSVGEGDGEGGGEFPLALGGAVGDGGGFGDVGGGGEGEVGVGIFGACGEEDGAGGGEEGGGGGEGEFLGVGWGLFEAGADGGRDGEGEGDGGGEGRGVEGCLEFGGSGGGEPGGAVGDAEVGGEGGVGEGFFGGGGEAGVVDGLEVCAECFLEGGEVGGVEGSDFAGELGGADGVFEVEVGGVFGAVFVREAEGGGGGEDGEGAKLGGGAGEGAADGIAAGVLGFGDDEGDGGEPSFAGDERGAVEECDDGVGHPDFAERDGKGGGWGGEEGADGREGRRGGEGRRGEGGSRAEGGDGADAFGGRMELRKEVGVGFRVVEEVGNDGGWGAAGGIEGVWPKGEGGVDGGGGNFVGLHDGKRIHKRVEGSNPQKFRKKIWCFDWRRAVA